MRIGFFTSIEGWGGSEIYLMSLMSGIRELGHDPVLFGVANTRLHKVAADQGIEFVSWKSAACHSERQSSSARLAGELTDDTDVTGRRGAWKSMFLSTIPFGVKLFLGSAREISRLKRIISDNPVDIMHINVHGYELAGIACRLCLVPSVGVYHTFPERDPYWFRRLLIRYTTNAFDKLCFLTAACEIAWQKNLAVKKDRCTVVYNGVDVSVPVGDVGSHKEHKNVFRVVSVGRLHAMKGFRYLIEAMAQLKDEKVVVDILGEGEQRNELEQLVAQLGLENAVNFRGHVENAAPYYAAANCMILASVSHEACPLVLPEAMASGLPLITSDFGPLPEMNIHGVTGFVVPAGDSKALGDAIRQLSCNSELAARFGKGSRDRYQYFRRGRMIEEMSRIYTDTLKRRREA